MGCLTLQIFKPLCHDFNRTMPGLLNNIHSIPPFSVDFCLCTAPASYRKMSTLKKKMRGIIKYYKGGDGKKEGIFQPSPADSISSFSLDKEKLVISRKGTNDENTPIGTKMESRARKLDTFNLQSPAFYCKKCRGCGDPVLIHNGEEVSPHSVPKDMVERIATPCGHVDPVHHGVPTPRASASARATERPPLASKNLKKQPVVIDTREFMFGDMPKKRPKARIIRRRITDADIIEESWKAEQVVIKKQSSLDSLMDDYWSCATRETAIRLSSSNRHLQSWRL